MRQDHSSQVMQHADKVGWGNVLTVIALCGVVESKVKIRMSFEGYPVADFRFPVR